VTRIKVGGLVVVMLGVAALSGALVSRASSSGPGQPANVALTLKPGVIHPMRGNIRSVLVLDGAVAAVDPIVVKARADGTISKVSKTSRRVAANAVLAVITAEKGRLRVLMPQTGVVLAAEIVKGQQVAVGDPLFTVAPARYTVTIPVDPALLYRLYERPLNITVAIDGGPAPFDCPYVSIGAATSQGANPLESQITLVCAVPATIRAFSGIRAQVAITTAAADNVLWLPVEAVEGAADLGRVTVVRDGQHLSQAVVLGITDGARVEIVSGLIERDVVLEFPDAVMPDPGASGQP
jgi:membrane fusion protein, macrolide-specific efflux system